jgi:L-amino acid N-acyltransferase YncA
MAEISPESQPIIRDCLESDLEAVQQIYAHYVETSTCTYEEIVPSLDEIRKRWASVKSKGMPFIVAEYQLSTTARDRKIAGYAYVSTYRERSGWRFTVENSIYLDKSCLGKGLGKILLKELILKCKNETPFTNIIAIIGGGTSNAASIALHSSLGFQFIGEMKKVGYKFEKWIDTATMQYTIERSDV